MRAGAGIAKRLRPRPRDGVAIDPLNWSDGQREMWEEGELQLTDDALLDFEHLGHVIGARFEFRVLDALVDADQHVAVDVGSVVNVPQVLDKILQFHPLVGCNEPMAMVNIIGGLRHRSHIIGRQRAPGEAGSRMARPGGSGIDHQRALESTFPPISPRDGPWIDSLPIVLELAGRWLFESITRGLLNRLFPQFHHEMALGSITRWLLSRLPPFSVGIGRQMALESTI